MDQGRSYESPVAGDCRSAPAALRNRDAIAEVLEGWLPERGLVLEIASGTGEHVVHFARRFPKIDWQPSDLDDAALASIAAWREDSRLANVRAPIRLDAASGDWPIGRTDAVLSINMVHISPWASALGLINGASRLLAGGAPSVLYGPWLEDGVVTAPSNLAFDADLRMRNPEWGLRKVELFAAEAHNAGFALEERRAMPANNVMLLFRRLGSGG